MVTLIASGVRSVFLQTQATHFEIVMTIVDEVSHKTKVPDEFILRSVLLDCFTPNSMSKLIHNQCKLKASYYSYMAAYMCANEHLGHCFDVLVCYSLLFCSKIILKQLFASGSVNIVE